MTAVDVPQLVAQAREGRPRAVARLISLVEGASPQLREVMAALAPLTGNAYVVGYTLSSDFPTTPGAFDTTKTDGAGVAFVTKLDAYKIPRPKKGA